MQQFAPSTSPSTSPSTFVEFLFSGFEFSKGDWQLQAYVNNTEIGRTEIAHNTHAPKWTNPMRSQYYFEVVQTLILRCFDSKGTVLGQIETTISYIASHGGSVTLPFKNNTAHKQSYITISMTEVKNSNSKVMMKFCAKNLDKKDLFGKSDGFLRISKPTDTYMGAWQTVHQTEVVKKSLNPEWMGFEISLDTLCNGNPSLPLLFQVFDWNSSGKEDFIGEFRVTLADIAIGKNFDLINPQKQSKRNYCNSGFVHCDNICVITKKSFLEYIYGGTQINLMVAIDFTGSNGDPKLADSLHFRGVSGTPYSQAISSVCNVVAPYDHDQMFPVYGFGAKIPPSSKVEHCFPLTFAANPEVKGLQGILDAYFNALSNVTLFGPTNFSDFLQVATQIAEQYHAGGGRQYLVLLILTDGDVSDREETIKKVVLASHLPLSIIIVGIGKADFSKMEELDADDKPLRYQGREMISDIVQFVPFNKFSSNPDFLAREVLQELPPQFVSYMERNRIQPQIPMIRQASCMVGLQPPQQPQQYAQQYVHQPLVGLQPPPQQYIQPQLVGLQPPQLQHSQFRVIQSFVGQSQGEATANCGDILSNVGQDSNGWTEVIVNSTGTRGWFPTSFMIKI